MTKKPSSRTALQRPLTVIVFFAGLIIVCVLMTLLSLQLFKPAQWAHDEPQGHLWLHHQLGLTDDEAAQIDAFEAPYRSDRQRLQAELDRRVRAIADLLQSHDSFSPEVSAAIHDLHIVHGQLQELAIKHYFDMLSVLPPDKQDDLRAMATEALSVPQ